MGTASYAVLKGLSKLHRKSPSGSGYTGEQIAVASWMEDKRALGLAGYETAHPDSHKTLSVLNNASGLVAKGLVERLSKGKFALAGPGWDAIGEDSGRSSDISFVCRLSRSTAITKFIYKKRTIDHLDAAKFWGAEHPSRVRSAVIAVLNLLGEQKEACFSGVMISQNTLRTIQFCSDYMEERFGEFGLDMSHHLLKED